MIRCYLALGSNLGVPKRQLIRAIKHIRSMPGTVFIKSSSLYFNKAWGRKLQPDFYNAVLAIDTRLTPGHLLAQCQAIERKQGRQRKVLWGARTLDIDILLYGNRRIHEQHLTIPHPRLLERDFVLTPLFEIAPWICLPDGCPVFPATGKNSPTTPCLKSGS